MTNSSIPIPSRSKRAFTLIELLVVILIIAILIAVAAPSFLGQQDKAKDSAAKQSISTAYKEAKAVATDSEGQFFAGTHSTAASLADAIAEGEPQLSISGGSGSDEGTVYVSGSASDADSVTLTVKSKSGHICTGVVTDHVLGPIDCGNAEADADEPYAPSTYAEAVALDNPVAWWHLDGDEADSLGGPNINAVAPYEWGSAPLVSGSVSSVPVRYGIYVSPVPATGSQFSVEVWLKYQSIEKSLLAFNASDGGVVNLRREADGASTLTVYNPASSDPTEHTATSSPLADPTQTHQYVITADGTTFTVYVDGAAVTSLPQDGFTLSAEDSLSQSGTYFTQDFIDEVSFYDSALPAEHVLGHFTTGHL